MRAKDSGSVLILALWSVSLLAILALSIGSMLRQKLVLMDRLESSGDLVPLALAGVERAKSVLRKDDIDPDFDSLRDEWASDNVHFKEIATEAGSFSVISPPPPVPEDRLAPPMRYGLIDEERKLNVNKADAPALARLLSSVAQSDEDLSQEIAFAIVDWRDTDSNYQHPDYGAEDDDYEDLKVPYAAKDAPIEVIEELLVVKGITRDIFDKIEPFVTPYGNGAVNINTAPQEVLFAIGISEDLALRILAYRAGSDGEALTPDDLIFTSPGSIAADLERMGAVSEPQRIEIENLFSTGKLGTISQFFTVHSHATLKGTGVSADAVAVIDRKGRMKHLRISKPKWPSRS